MRLSVSRGLIYEIYILNNSLVPSKGSALEELLGRAEKPSGTHLAAAADQPSDGKHGRDCGTHAIAESAGPSSHGTLPPSVIICIKNAIELEYNQ